MATTAQSALTDLYAPQNNDLLITQLSRPFLEAEPSTNSPTSARTSNGSSISNLTTDTPSPLSLEADLSHYRELFSKLRFSYLEQVTKEKFLRAIVGHPPLIVSHEENMELEQKMMVMKSDLKAQKEQVDGMVEEIRRVAGELARQHEEIQLQTTQLQTYPEVIDLLRTEVTKMRGVKDLSSSDPTQCLSLSETNALLKSRRSELETVKAQIRDHERSIAEATKQEQSLARELKSLDQERDRAISAAKEARAKQASRDGGVADDLGLQARWYTGVNTALQNMLEI